MSNNKNIFSLFKIVAFVLLIIFVVIISVSWPYSPLSLSLVFVLLLLCFLKNWKTGVWLTIIFGGFFLDLYSIFPPGFFLLSLGFFYLIIKKISRRFNVSSGSGFFFLILGSALIYKIIILALSSIFYFLKLSNQLIAINYFYFLDVFWFMIVNSFFVFLILATFKVWSQK